MCNCSALISPFSMRRSSAPSPSTRVRTGTWIATLRRVSLIAMHPRLVRRVEECRRLAVDRLEALHHGRWRKACPLELRRQRVGVGILGGSVAAIAVAPEAGAQRAAAGAGHRPHARDAAAHHHARMPLPL